MAETLLDAILEPGSLTPLFQPIFDLWSSRHAPHSFECLMRGPKGTSVESAAVMFDYVRRKREEVAVDHACVRAALEAAAQLPGEPCVAINVHVRTLAQDKDFVGDVKRMAEELGIAPWRLTLELVEPSCSWDAQSLQRALEELRKSGMRLAVDDVGSGQSNYSMILDSQPEALKVDAYLVQGCHADKHRVATLESIVTLARDFDAQVVAEGLEERPDLDTILSLGVRYGQGYMLARPMSVQALVERSRLDDPWPVVGTVTPESAGRS